jgi:hypothetical protein
MPHNLIPRINRTVSVLNIGRLDLLDKWHSNYLQTKFSDPIELVDHYAFGSYSLSAITPELKEHIRLNKSGRAWDYIKHLTPASNSWQLQSVVQQHDALHGTNLLDFDPDLYNIIFQ